MNATEAARLRELIEKATPGPWVERDIISGGAVWAGDEVVAGTHDRCADNAFIAAARTALPAALDMLNEAMSALRHRICCLGSPECPACREGRELSDQWEARPTQNEQYRDEADDEEGDK